MLVAIFAYGSIMVLAGVGTVSDQVWLIGLAVVLSGLPSGVLNTLFTDLAMSSGGTDTPALGVQRGLQLPALDGGAAIAAVLVAYLAKWFGSDAAPWWFATAYCVVALGAVALIQGVADDEIDDDAALIGAEEF